MPIGGPEAFVTLRRDEYGIVRAASWWPNRDGLCVKTDDLNLLSVEGCVVKARVKHAAAVGVAEHGNSAVLVTVAANGVLLDRRRIDLTRGLPTHPYHHEGSWAIGRYADSSWAKPISLPDAVALVKRVHQAAARGAHDALDELAASLTLPITHIAIRICAKLPPTIEERIADSRAASMADSILYREALAGAAEARGWRVFWYDRERVFRDAKAAIGGKDVNIFLRAMGRSAGAPWQARHKLAAAAALATSLRVRSKRLA